MGTEGVGGREGRCGRKGVRRREMQGGVGRSGEEGGCGKREEWREDVGRREDGAKKGVEGGCGEEGRRV